MECTAWSKNHLKRYTHCAMYSEMTTEMLLRPLTHSNQPLTFLALGQTVLWDEPSKAGTLASLKARFSGSRVVVGVHDTDYFAKAPRHPELESRAPFFPIGHDDWMTRGLWSAAGEMHRLLGSEDPPTLRDIALRGGVSMHAVRKMADNEAAVLSSLTMADGWTGLVQSGWQRTTVRDISLSRILPALLEQVHKTITDSEQLLSGQNHDITDRITGWITDFAAGNPEATLPDLYAVLLPKLHTLVHGTHVIDEVTRTSELLALSPDTAHLPRFAVAELFLNPETAAVAVRAYNDALIGSDIYPLNLFGEGATPFDVSAKGAGRGTLFVFADRIEIDFETRVTLYASITGLCSLAELLVSHGYEAISLVGKAVTLLPMLAAEHAIVFHVGASGYSPLSHRFVMNCRKARLPLPPLFPIVRVGLRTWEALSTAPSREIQLPAALAQALSRPKVDSDDFALCWNRAIEWESARLTHLQTLRSPKQVAHYLVCHEGQPWCALDARLQEVTRLLQVHGETTQIVRDRKETIKQSLAQLSAQRSLLEVAKGNDFRARGQVLTAFDLAERGLLFDAPLGQLVEKVNVLKTERYTLTKALRSAERAIQIQELRLEKARLTGQLETRRAEIVANALRVVNGLEHAGHRPTSWWFPLVDPTGNWYQSVVRSATYMLEALDT